MVSDQTDHHPMGATTEAYEYSTAQTGYDKRPINLTRGIARHSAGDGNNQFVRTHRSILPIT